ncbi:MAG: cell division protein FtsZ, partial [Pseudomonadota bacterium]
MTELKPRIVVIGVGGAGGNAVDNMIESNLQGVEFYVANTDAQAMTRSKTQNRLQLGLETTGGLGAGAKPEIGEASAEESLEDINEVLDGAHMVFVAAGMGGGTGTGAAPVIAKAAHDRGILTIGVITKPFSFEGTHRMKTAEGGLDKMKDAVDTLIVVPNQNLFRIANERTTFAEAFRMADDVLYCGVKGITDLMIMPGLINLDFADVRTIMKGMGTAMMGMGEGEGEGRAMEAARSAIDNPLLDDISLAGAKGVLINITGGYDMTLFELDEAANEIRRQVDEDANIILGSTFEPELEGRIRVSVVAAGLDDVAEAAAQPPATETMASPAPSIVNPL